MNKDQLQKEILEKIREGIKPSDLKKQRGNNTSTTIPQAPPLPKEKSKTNSEQSEPKNNELLTKIKDLEEKNKFLIENIIKLKNQGEKQEKDNDKLFTCLTCQKSFDIKFLRLVDKNNRKICRSCLLKMMDRANQITGQEIVLRKKKKEENLEVSSNQTKTFTCQICQQSYQGKPHEVHITNYQEQGIIPQELTAICSFCLEDKVIIADFYCPRTSEGRDSYTEPQFDCYCPTK